jgi:hypothetical protein
MEVGEKSGSPGRPHTCDGLTIPRWADAPARIGYGAVTAAVDADG